MAKSVYVGLSGGVDSSLTAALLKELGYDVTAVYMKNWTQDIPGFDCPWQADFNDAKRVAVKLDIPLKVYDFEKDYKKQVVDYLIDGYKQGLTPNPDIICNQEIKFKLFLNTAISEGADLIATGHYARVKDGKLLTAKDVAKDQTYFLYRLQPEALKRTLMPIGEYHKSEVRQLAKRRGLPTADKKDSQGICFIGKVGIKEFLVHELGPQPPGDIVDDNGLVIGRHDGAIFYTIGQRHGLDVGGGLPYYVIGKDIKANIVYVTTNLDDKNLWSDRLKLTAFHLTDPKFKQTSKLLNVVTRYHAKPIKCHLKLDGHKAEAVLDQPVKATAAGQSAVFYDGDVVIGGGILI